MTSDDEWLAEERVRDLLARLAAADRTEIVGLEAEASGVPGLAEALFAPSLFADDRVVVVRSGEKLQSGGLKALVDALGSAGGDLRVIVVAVGDRLPPALSKALPGVKAEHVSRPRRGQLVAWVAQRFKAAGVVPGNEAPGLLVEALGANLRDLVQAVDVLSLRVGRGGVVDAADVAAAFPGIAEQPTWALYDALLASDGRRAYRVLHALLDQGEDPIAILFAVVAQNRGVMRAKSVLERTPGTADAQLASAIGVSPGRAAVMRRQASHAAWEWLVRLHHECAIADFDLKGGDEVRIVGLLPPELVLERLLDRVLPAIELVRG